MKELLSKSFRFTLDDVRKNTLVPFQVDKAYDHMLICLKYSPKHIREKEIIMPQIERCVERYFPKGYTLSEEDMKEYDSLLNFVTLSLDKGDEYVGCAHRHPPEQTLRIAKTSPAWGFAPCEVTKGDWRIVLHVQAVVIGEIDYRLKVFGMEEGDSDDQIPTL